MDTKKLRQKILDLAIHGKLVPQDPNDEPASVLLERIRAEKEALIKEGKIKRNKKSASSDTPHYENIPFEVPKGWSWIRFSDIASFGGGKTPSMENKEYWDNGTHLWVTSKDMKSNVINDSMMKISDEAIKIMQVYQPGTLLMVTRSGILRRMLPLAILGKEATVNQDLKTISIVAPVLPGYIFYAILANESMILKDYHKDGTTVDSINFDKFVEMLIPLPPTCEQQRIIDAIETYLSLVEEIKVSENDILVSIDSARSKILDLAIHGKLVPQDANDEPALELLKRINPMAVASCDNPHYAEPYELPNGWTWCKLADLCSFLSRGKSPKYSDTDTTYPVFAQKCNLKEGGISLEKALFLEPSTLCKWPEVYHLRTGDVLVNSTGTGTVGRTRLFDDACLGEYPFVVPDSHVSVIRTHSEIVSEYIYALMSSSWIQTYLGENLAGSTNQKELYIGVLQNIDVPLPPVSEQRRIAIKIGSLNQQLDSIIHLFD